MKILHKLWVAALLLVATTLTFSQRAAAQADGTITLQTFYDELSPYGTWINDQDYGPVWLPDVDADFRPYATAGHWALTDYGNTWVSDYDWGWAPFHYGRWRFDDYYGWEWIPDYEWGPAWVNWRSGNGYYGWAPLGPSIDIDMAFGGYNIPDFYWMFAPQAYITSPRIYNYYLPRTRVTTIIRSTNIIRNTYTNRNVRYITGPRVNDIRTVTRNNNIRIYHINNAERPGAARFVNNNINIYRPAVNRGGNARPPRIVDAQAYRNANPNGAIANRNSGTNNGSRATDFSRTVRSNNTYNNNAVPVRRGDYRNDNRNNGGFPANRPNQQPAGGQGTVNTAPAPNAGQPGSNTNPNRFNRPNNNGDVNTGANNDFRRNRFNRNNNQNNGQQPNNGQPNPQQQDAGRQQRFNPQQSDERRQQWQQRRSQQQPTNPQQPSQQQGQQQADQQRQAQQMQQQRERQQQEQQQRQQMQRQQNDQQRQQMQQQQADQQRQIQQQQRQQEQQQRQQQDQQRRQQEQQQRQQGQQRQQQEQQQRQQQEQQRRQAAPVGERSSGGRP